MEIYCNVIGSGLLACHLQIMKVVDSYFELLTGFLYSAAN